MANVFNNINFQNPASLNPVKPQSAVSYSSNQSAVADSVELSNPAKTGIKNPVKSLKGTIANVRKTFSSAGEYIKGSAKGITNGVVTGSVVYTAGSIINNFKSKKAVKTGAKAGKLPNKFLAVLTGGLVIAANLWNSSLNANEKRSNIDHRYIGHENIK